MPENKPIQNYQFDSIKDAVRKGLAHSPKKLPSWLFYDEKGDELFRQIMRMPEYYLSNCEYDIFENNSQVIFNDFSSGGNKAFDLIELGAGDGVKTEVLLEKFLQSGSYFNYLPVDISPYVLNLLEKRLNKSLPKLRLKTIPLDFETALKRLDSFSSDNRKIFLFLGSNIGNMSFEDAVVFLKKIASKMVDGDLAMVGFDLRKDPRIILKAYDDSQGITSAFNLNLLTRLNRELGADFNLQNFSHYPHYDPVSGMAKSFLVSERNQEVRFPKMDKTYEFAKWELIHTEISRKFNSDEIRSLGQKAGLEIKFSYEDHRGYYSDVVFGL